MAAVLKSSTHDETLPAERPSRLLFAWAAFALLLLVAPLVFDSSASLTFMSQLGTLVILALSFNMLFGQAGMLSFGHAIYPGLGAYFAIHAMNLAAKGALPVHVPVVLIPLVGGVAGMAFGVLFGYVSTRRAGTAFAMITMGICELVYACSQMFPKFFGGEGGITANRSYGEPLLGLTFGPQIQVYYLIVAWLLLSAGLMYALTQTPLGRMANAVRDNAERAEFIGYNPQTVRYLTMILATFFAGISGALAAINFEIVGADSLSVARSGDGLLFTFIGGAGNFVGPIIGAIVGGTLVIKLSDVSPAWQFYLGAFFILLVMYAPGGLSGIAASNWRAMRSGHFARVFRAWLAMVAAGALLLAGSVVLVELAYAQTFGAEKVAIVRLLNSLVGTAPLASWALGVLMFGAGVACYRMNRRAFGTAWGEVQALAIAGERRSTP